MSKEHRGVFAQLSEGKAVFRRGVNRHGFTFKQCHNRVTGHNSNTDKHSERLTSCKAKCAASVFCDAGPVRAQDVVFAWCMDPANRFAQLHSHNMK